MTLVLPALAAKFCGAPGTAGKIAAVSALVTDSSYPTSSVKLTLTLSFLPSWTDGTKIGLIGGTGDFGFNPGIHQEPYDS